MREGEADLLYAELGGEALEHLSGWREVALRVKEAVSEMDPGARVYAFGSAPAGRFTAASDVDVLVVSDELASGDRARIKAEVIRRVGISVPLEVHLATEGEFASWYSRFVSDLREV